MLKTIKTVATTAAAMALTAGGAQADTLDLAPLVNVGANVGLVIVAGVAAWLVLSRIKNTALQAQLEAAIPVAIQFAQNKIDGALVGKPMTVQVGSSVAAEAGKFLLAEVPDLLNTFGLNEMDIARLVWAHLPGVEGAAGDAVFNTIVGSLIQAQQPTPAPVPAAAIPASVPPLTNTVAGS